ncbi:MAG: hypothetical protein KBG84_08660 [Planctomycetes bacterium]|nr:hypothetical protein [Planctomycetota bacterium]
MSVKGIIRRTINKLTPKKKVVYVERVRNVPVVVKRTIVVKRAAPRKGLILVRRRVTIRRKVAR